MAWTSLCDRSELIEGQGKYVEIGGFYLGVFLDRGEVFVTDNYCPHAGGNLSSGFIDDGCILCPWHAWAFQLSTGELRSSPRVKIKTYPTRLLPKTEDRAEIVQADLPIF